MPVGPATTRTRRHHVRPPRPATRLGLAVYDPLITRVPAVQGAGGGECPRRPPRLGSLSSRSRSERRPLLCLAGVGARHVLSTERQHRPARAEGERGGSSQGTSSGRDLAAPQAARALPRPRSRAGNTSGIAMTDGPQQDREVKDEAAGAAGPGGEPPKRRAEAAPEDDGGAKRAKTVSDREGSPPPDPSRRTRVLSPRRVPGGAPPGARGRRGPRPPPSAGGAVGRSARGQAPGDRDRERGHGAEHQADPVPARGGLRRVPQVPPRLPQGPDRGSPRRAR